MTDKEKYDFIDRVVHLTLFAEDRLLNEHGGEYSGLEEDGIDSNEYYRIITERVINILKKNNNYMQEEPVSEDLKEAANGYATKEAAKDIGGDWTTVDILNAFKAGAQWQKEKDAILPKVWNRENLDDFSYQTAYDLSNDWAKETPTWHDVEMACKLGANWQKEQFEKNRLAACDKQTEEEAEIEHDFVMGIIEKEHRLPAFDDAIKYGMKLQKEQVMAKAIDVTVHIDAGGYPYIPQMEPYDYDKDVPLAKEGDKYKVVLIKE